MTKREQIEELAKKMCLFCKEMTEEKDCERGKECFDWRLKEARFYYEQGYRIINKDSVALTKEEWECLHNDYAKALYNARQQARKETAREIFQRVINICIKEEDFQDGTVNTQLEPLYFGIMNGCAFVRGEVKELAKQYGVEVEE